MERGRGRGRGRGYPPTMRGRGRGHTSGRQQQPQSSGGPLGATQPQWPQRGRGQRTHPYTPFPETSGTSRQHSRQEHTETSGTSRQHSRQEHTETSDTSRQHSRQEHTEASGTSRQHSRQEHTGTREQRRERKIQPEEIGMKFESKLSLSSKFPKRPGVGTAGKRIRLVSNCFPVQLPRGNVYHYDVTIIEKRRNPKKEAEAPQDDKKRQSLNKKRNREIINLMIQTYPMFRESPAAYDGQKNLYTSFALDADFPIIYEVLLDDENINPENPPENRVRNAYEVQINPVKKPGTESCKISLDSLSTFYERQSNSVPQETIMALEAILRHGPSLEHTPIGRNFFYPKGLHPLGGGIEIWLGYHQSVRLGQWGPMVNLNLSATTFYQKGPVLNYVAEFLNTTVDRLRQMQHIPDAQVKRISSKLKNLRIETTHERNYRRKYRILKLDFRNANRLTFDLTENETTVRTTIADYFRQRYNRNLQFPHLPCLQVNPERANRFLPIEVCDVLAGQHCKKNLEPRQKSEMIRFTSVPPSERFAEIARISRDANFNSDRTVQDFGIDVSQRPLSLEGRVLDAPRLIYKNESVVMPRDGSWNMREIKFLHGAEVKSWVLLSFVRIDAHALERFSNLLLKVGRNVDLSINSPRYIGVIDPNRCGDMMTLLSRMKEQYNAELAVIVLPVADKEIYGNIKTAAETSVGLATQCISERNVTDPKKCSMQLVNNLCLKINAKMRGENNSILRNEIEFLMNKPVIFIGADVNHPGPSRGIKPSLAACVGSLDRKLSRYAVSIRVQPNVDKNKKSVEIITDLKGMVLELLKAFYHHTKGLKPEKIIFYRDGVSEGQFDEVQDKEVAAIRAACKSLPGHYEPSITFIVVQKRHNVRFRPDDPRDGAGGMKNIPPGTTVDTVVTHPVNFDYYLCSHFGLKGTSRPSHYTVLEDDNGFTADQIHQLTYQLCHTYARCTRSISIPVPVAYADLAAYRARLHLETSTQSSSDSDISTGEDILQLPQHVINSVQIMAGVKDTMYFV